MRRGKVINDKSIYFAKEGDVIEEDGNEGFVVLKLDAGRVCYFFTEEVEVTSVDDKIAELQRKKAEIVAAMQGDDKKSRAARATLQANKEKLDKEIDDAKKDKDKDK